MKRKSGICLFVILVVAILLLILGRFFKSHSEITEGTDVKNKIQSAIKEKNISDDKKTENIVGIFPDENLEKAIRKKINRPSGDIYIDDVKNIKELVIEDNEISNLEGIQYLSNLQKLWLCNNEIKDISLLSDLSNLDNLDLSKNKIEDISSLGNLYNLKFLNLSGNSIQDINSLQGISGGSLINLQYLILSSNKIEDINSLSKEVNLVGVDLSNNRIEDINPLSRLHNLIDLSLSNNRVEDINSLDKLVRLQQLKLDNNKIKDISSLGNLNKLKRLWIGGNKISDIRPLSRINDLEELYLGIDLRFDVSEIMNLKNVKYCHLCIDILNMDEILDEWTPVYEEAYKEIYDIVEEGMSDIEKERAVYDYVIKHNTYDCDNYVNNSIPLESYISYGVFKNGKSVCLGYASAMNVLLNKVGIENIIVIGEVKDMNEWGPHAWNIVKIDGKYYHVDATVDDVISERRSDQLRYYYFNLSDKEIEQNYRWDREFYPECKK